MKTRILLITLLIVLSCKKRDQPVYNPSPPVDTVAHKDTAYQYEHRTGTSGNYEYTYDVTGSDAKGNQVSGTVEVEGKFGRCTLKKSNGINFEVEVEWIDYGVLKATDKKGNEYQLEVTK
jgi:hypothetical protein